ncbi:MAG: ribonuclease Z [Gammaproteobacteria bacterium]|jgi:ribonuclease Z|nr:ribonuclease Z [Gammaproteobacteria bacterium]|tara:strand:- start:30 stop:1088 length:1059 start_codon:yes stop_codon:yes gene_type:complete
MKKVAIGFITLLVVLLVVLAGIAGVSLSTQVGQNFLLNRIAALFVREGATALPDSESLRVFVCGSASPLGVTDRAQACIAVLTPEHFFIVDSGAGSTDNLNRGRLPMARLQGIFITHFHSDHIAELYEVNLNSWVQGRTEQLVVYGPEGVERVTEAVNEGYALDREYRVAHHGEALLKPVLGELVPETLEPGVVFDDGALKITLYTGDHPPIVPAAGYRFDYQGRSVVISGDSLVTDETRRIVAGADLLLHDALSESIVSTLSGAAGEAGLDRISKVMSDVMDYHASTTSLVTLADSTNVDMVALYHLVPAPVNSVIEKIFESGLPSNYLLADDGMWFELPLGSDDIVVAGP